MITWASMNCVISKQALHIFVWDTRPSGLSPSSWSTTSSVPIVPATTNNSTQVHPMDFEKFSIKSRAISISQTESHIHIYPYKQIPYNKINDKLGYREESSSPKASFKDKLVGVIPGAYSQAFNFSVEMEEDLDSDNEVLELREGIAAMKLSKVEKKRIRAPWGKALIVKVFGWTVASHFFILGFLLCGSQWGELILLTWVKSFS